MEPGSQIRFECFGLGSRLLWSLGLEILAIVTAALSYLIFFFFFCYKTRLYPLTRPQTPTRLGPCGNGLVYRSRSVSVPGFYLLVCGIGSSVFKARASGHVHCVLSVWGNQYVAVCEWGLGIWGAMLGFSLPRCSNFSVRVCAYRVCGYLLELAGASCGWHDITLGDVILGILIKVVYIII